MRFSIFWKLGFWLGCFFMFTGAAGSCAPMDCPTGRSGGDGVCVHDIVPDGKWNVIRPSELRVRVLEQEGAGIRRLAFWLVQDPGERMEPALSKRVGRWKILLRDYEPASGSRSLSLSWKLREKPSALGKGETIRLLGLRPGADPKQAEVFPGHYDAVSGRVHATIAHKRFSYRGLLLVPVRSPLAQISRR